MHDFQEKRRLRAFLGSRVVLISMFLLLIGAGIASFRALEAGWKVQAERVAMEERLRKLEEEKRTLSSGLKELNSEEGIEREARQKLNFRKSGEEVVIIRDAETSSGQEQKTKAFSFFGSLKKFLINFISP